MACVESKWIFQRKAEKIENKELRMACNHVMDNLRGSHFLLRGEESVDEEQMKKDISGIGGSIFHCLYPLILFISTNMSFVIESLLIKSQELFEILSKKL